MMKWWGWGDAKFEFPMKEKPELWPWIAKTLDLREDRTVKPIERRDIKLQPAQRHEAFIAALGRFLKPDQYAADDESRLIHSYGKSYPDLFNIRRGVIRRAPDLVLYPEGHGQVEEIIRCAQAHGVVVIPFGGGTNITGGVNPVETGRMVATLDMQRMNRVLSLDPYSNTATIEAGALGPKLEKDLQARGYSLGHCPDSFEYSSLGGWLATRSAGMQSDAYGRIEDMLVALRLVTPAGTLTTKAAPASSAGPDLNRLVVGSEGVLGVITEATMRVHPAPQAKDYRGILFPTFEHGVAAIHELIEKNCLPSMIRLQDDFETELGMHMKSPATGIMGFVQHQVKKVLKARGYAKPAVMVVGVEGSRRDVDRVRRETGKVLSAHRGFDLGAGVGRTWAQDKFNLPYLRDAVMDQGVMVDVAETATVWSNVLPLYYAARDAVKAKFAAEGTPGFIGCHISHTYPTGCCLYFTYACRQLKGRELEQYYSFKKMMTDVFMKNGAALTHHHAVGSEHRPWLEKEISPTGLKALKAVKASLDPSGICNPGKLIPDEGDPMAGWALSTETAAGIGLETEKSQAASAV